MTDNLENDFETESHQDDNEEEMEPSCSKVSKRTKGQSIVQKFFDKNGAKARCKKCSTDLLIKGGCSSTLLRHLKARHPGSFETALGPDEQQKTIFECFSKDGNNLPYL